MKTSRIALSALAVIAALLGGYAVARSPRIAQKISQLFGVQAQEVEFAVRDLRLRGTLYTPERFMSGKRPAIVFCHGGTPIGRKLALYVVAARQLAERGYVVLTFDFRGFGDSDDPRRFESADDLDFTQDISAALTYLSGLPFVESTRLYVIGHSFGAGVALPASVKDERVRKTVSMSPPRNTQARQYAADAEDPMYPTRRLSGDMGIEPPIPPAIFYPHLREHVAEEILRYPNHPPILFIDGANEDAQERRFLRTVFTQMREPKGYVTIPGADHYYGTRRDQNGGLGDTDCDAAPMTALAQAIDDWFTGKNERPSAQEVSFSSGGVFLRGTLYLPPFSGQKPPGVVLCHGATPLGRRHALYGILANLLAARGYAVLAFDFRGFGESDDPPRLENFSDLDFAQDVRAAVTRLAAEKQVDAARIFAVGHAFGAGIAAQAALRDARVNAVISISPARRNQELFFAENAPLADAPQQRLSQDMRLSIPKALLYPHLKDQTAEAMLRYPSHPPILFIDGALEDQADRDFLRSVFENMRGAKQYVTIPDADLYYGAKREQAYENGMEESNRVAAAALDAMDAWLRQH